ncbi:Ubiquitin-conjugating enzyme E2 6 [Tulasnella sp. 408]|nr:Ubiquitin-conjugating enzyme E2 6 [Tulasnella sp. 408]
MLSDEITTGSITTSDQDKRILAARSHAWNIQQKKFQEAFPEYSEQTMKDLPNMGEADRGKPSEESEPATPASSSTAAPTPAPSTPALPPTAPAIRGFPVAPLPQTYPATPTPRGPTGRPGQEVAPVPAARGPNGANPDRTESWTASLGSKWGVAALIVFAVLLSRAST